MSNLSTLERIDALSKKSGKASISSHALIEASRGEAPQASGSGMSASQRIDSYLNGLAAQQEQARQEPAASAQTTASGGAVRQTLTPLQRSQSQGQAAALAGGLRQAALIRQSLPGQLHDSGGGLKSGSELAAEGADSIRERMQEALDAASGLKAQGKSAVESGGSSYRVVYDRQDEIDRLEQEAERLKELLPKSEEEKIEDIRRQIKELKAEGTAEDADGLPVYSRQAEIEALQQQLREMAPSLGERLGKTATGAVRQHAGGVASAIGTGLEGLDIADRKLYSEELRTEARQLVSGIQFLKQKQVSTQDEQERQSLAADIVRLQAQLDRDLEILGDDTPGYGENMRNIAAEGMRKGAEDIERAKLGAGELGKLAIDAGAAGVQMGLDAATGMFFGSSMAPMLTRSFGGAAEEARQKGYSRTQQIALGIASAATEYFTEKLFGGNPVYDSNAGLVNRLAARVSGNEDLIKAMNSLPADLLSEGVEEMISDVLNPIAELAVTGRAEWPEIDEILRDGAVGVLTAVIGHAGAGAANAALGTRQGDSGRKKTAEEVVSELLDLHRQMSEQPAASRQQATPTAMDVINEILGVKQPTNAQEAPGDVRTATDTPANEKAAYDEAYAYRDSLLAENQKNIPSGTGDTEQSPVYGKSVGAATRAKGEQVQTQNRTVTNSKYMTDAEKQRFAPGTHERISEEMSLNRAGENFYTDSEGQIIMDGVYGTAEDLIKSAEDGQIWTGEEYDTAQLALKELVREARETNDYSRAAALNKVMEEQGTLTGRSLQARRKWAASPESIIASAAETLAPGEKDTGRLSGEMQREVRKTAAEAARDSTFTKRAAEVVEKRQRTIDVRLWNAENGLRLARVLTKEDSKGGSTAMKTIYSDLMRLARENGAPRAQRETDKRTAIDLIRDFINNHDAYQKAWEVMQSEVGRAYPPGSERAEAFSQLMLTDTLPTGGILDAQIINAALEAADSIGVSRQTMNSLAALGSIDGITDRLASEIIEATGAGETDATVIRSGVSRYLEHISESIDRQRTVRREISASAKDTGIDIGRLLVENYDSKQQAFESIRDYITEKYGLSGDDSEAAAREISSEYFSLLAEKTRKALEARFGEKKTAERAQKSWIDRLTEAINLGALSDESFRDAAAARLFGENAAKAMDDISRLAYKLEAAEDAGALRDIITETSKVRATGTLFKNRLPGEIRYALDYLVKNGETDFLRDAAAAGVRSIAADYGRPSASDSVFAVRRMAMLSKVSTIMRNLVSNGVFDVTDSVSRDIAVPLDKLLSRYTGTRSLAADRSWISSAKREGSLDGLLKAVVEVGLDIDTDGAAGKYEVHKNRTFSMNGGTVSRLLSAWEKLQGYALNATDEFSKGGIEAEIQRGIDELYSQGRIKDDSLKDAGRQAALYRTFQDENRATKAVLSARRGLNSLARAGDMLLPFAQVPTNLGVRALEYSPAGLAKSTVDLLRVLKDARDGTLTAAQQAKAVEGIGRGLNGTALIAASVWLASNGLLKVLNPSGGDDDDKVAVEKSQGRNGTQLNISAALRAAAGEGSEWQHGDKLISVAFLDPLNAMLTTGALIAEDEKKTLGSALTRSIEGTLQSIMDLPVMEKFADIAQTYRYSKADSTGGKVLDTAAQIAAADVSSIIPNALAGIAAGTDRYQRDVYTRDDIVGQTADSILSKIPGLRQTLPVKRDAFGRPAESSASGVLGFLNSNILPGMITVYRDDEVTKGLRELYEETGDTGIYLNRKAPNSFSHDGVKYQLTQNEKYDFQGLYGDIYTEYARAVFDDPDFADLPGEQKAAVMEDVKAMASSEAKEMVLENRGSGRTLSDAETAKRALEAGDYATYLIYSNAYKAAKNGDTGAYEQLMEDYEELPEPVMKALETISGFKRLENANKAGMSTAAFMEMSDATAGYSKNADKFRAVNALDWTDSEKLTGIKQLLSSEKMQNAFDTAYEKGVKLDSIIAWYEVKNSADLSDSEISEIYRRAGLTANERTILKAAFK